MHFAHSCNVTNFWQIEDNLSCLANGRGPQFWQIEDNLNLFLDGRRPQFVFNWNITSIFLPAQTQLVIAFNHYSIFRILN